MIRLATILATVGVTKFAIEQLTEPARIAKAVHEQH